MDLRCFKIPFNAGFIKNFSELLIKNNLDLLPDLSSILIIFPSKRSKYYFRREVLSTSGLSGMFPPVIYSIDELVEKLHLKISQFKKSTFLMQSMLIHNAVIDKKAEFTDAFNIEDKSNLTDFIKFYPFSIHIIKFFDELEAEEVTFKQLRIKGVYSDYENRIKVLEDIYNRYIEMLRIDNLATKGKILRSVIDGYNFSSLGRMYKSVYFAGFSFLTELEKRLFLKISGSVAGASFIIHSGDEDLDLKLINRFRLNPETMAAKEKINPEIKVFEAKSDASQVSFIIESINEFHKKGIPLSSIAVIVPNPSIIPLMIQAFKNYSIPFNVTAGLTLKSTPLFTLLNSLLNLFTGRPFYHTPLSSFISHSYIKNLTLNGCSLKPQCYTLSEFLKMKNIVYLNYDKNKEKVEFKELLDFINLNYSSFIEIKTLSDFSIFIREFLQNFQLVDNEIMGGYFNQYYKTVCDVLSDFETSGLRFDMPSKFFSFFITLLEGKTVNLFGNPFEGVQVMGLLEARNLDFKAKIITSLNENIFPPPYEKDIFLNSEIRKLAGLPTRNDRESLYRYMFKELISGANFFHISYKSDPSFMFEKSRYAEKLIEDGIDNKLVSVRSLFPFSPLSRIKSELKELSKADFHELLKNLTYSPSMIKDLLECRYRFYLKYILKLEEGVEITEELEKRDYGNIIHRVMNKFFKIREFKCGVPQELEKKGIESVIRLIAEEVKKEANLSAADRMAFELLKNEIKKWIKNEIDLCNHGHRVESRFSEEQINVKFPCGSSLISLSGRVDRVNSFNGGYFIIDYKARNLPEKREMLINEDFKEVQLPFYALLLKFSEKLDYSAIKGLAYYDLKKNFSLEKIAEGYEPDYVQSFEEFLTAIFDRLFNPEVPFTLADDIKNCRYCSFGGICRVKDRK